jgi:hypothetical protein
MGSFKSWFWRITGESAIRKLSEETREILKKADTEISLAETSPKSSVKLSHLQRAKTLNDEARKTTNKMQAIRDKQDIRSALLVFVIFVGLEVLWAFGKNTNVSINLYIVIAQIIPIFLIALSVFTVKQRLTKRGYLALLLADVVPVIAGELACLIAIGSGKSTSLTLATAIYAITSLLFQFCAKGFQYISTE